MPCQHGVPECRVQMKRRLYVRPAFFFVRTTGIMPERRFRRPRLCTLHPPASRNGWSNARNLIPSDPAGPHKSAARHARLPAKRHFACSPRASERCSPALHQNTTSDRLLSIVHPAASLIRASGRILAVLSGCGTHAPTDTHAHTHSCSQSYPDV